MSESELHLYLKLLGLKWLDEHGCYLVASEIPTSKNWKLNLDVFKNDKNIIPNRRYIIDCLGICKKPILERNYRYSHPSFNKIGDDVILRGIEIKISRSDFKQGFIYLGLNYHYVLTPELLVKKSEIPNHVGLLYYNKKNKCIDVHKRPKKLDISENEIDGYITKIYARYHSQIMRMTRKQIKLLGDKINESG